MAGWFVDMYRRPSMHVSVTVNRRKTFIPAVLTAGFLLMSCSARRPGLRPYGPFRIESASGDSVLLTPPIPDGSDKLGSIELAFKSRPAPPGLHCFAERGHFRIEQEKEDPNSVDITMPSPASWLSDFEGRLSSPGDSGIEALFAILADLDKLRGEGCFVDSKLSIRDLILQSLPMRPTDSLFNYYSYLADRSGLDLRPGMRLKVERAYLQPGEAGEEQHNPKRFLGVSTTYFRLRLASNGELRFHQQGTVRYTPASLVDRVEDGISDLGLSAIPQERYFRLVFNTYFVSEKQMRSTAIIGAERTSQLDQLDAELRAHPDEDCKNASAIYGAVCFGFAGLVTLTPEVKIELNGKTKFIDSGTRIKEVLPGSKEEALKSLRIERRFLDSYHDLRFDPADLNVLSLTLVAGDRVTLSNGSRVLH